MERDLFVVAGDGRFADPGEGGHDVIVHIQLCHELHEF
jgi:hypothetical protein